MGRCLFVSVNSEAWGAIAFRADSRQFRIVLSLPRPAGPSSVLGEAAEDSNFEAKAKIHERVSRRFWHALAVAIDAKLNAAAAGTATLESEFPAHVVLPGNRTVLDRLQPIIDSAYRSVQHPSFSIPAVPLPVTGGHARLVTPRIRARRWTRPHPTRSVPSAPVGPRAWEGPCIASSRSSKNTAISRTGRCWSTSLTNWSGSS